MRAPWLNYLTTDQALHAALQQQRFRAIMVSGGLGAARPGYNHGHGSSASPDPHGN